MPSIRSTLFLILSVKAADVSAKRTGAIRTGKTVGSFKQEVFQWKTCSFNGTEVFLLKGTADPEFGGDSWQVIYGADSVPNWCHQSSFGRCSDPERAKFAK